MSHQPSMLRYCVFQSTRPARGATFWRAFLEATADISIHAPREGRDLRVSRSHTPARYFNPRAPRGARPSWTGSPSISSRNFNPRAPRGARLVCDPHSGRQHDFNPRAPRGARQRRTHGQLRGGGISIHAPREGRDWVTITPDPNDGTFQSTRPARGATDAQDLRPRRARNFNPRAPRGARR